MPSAGEGDRKKRVKSIPAIFKNKRSGRAKAALKKKKKRKKNRQKTKKNKKRKKKEKRNRPLSCATPERKRRPVGEALNSSEQSDCKEYGKRQGAKRDDDLVLSRKE